LNHLHASNRSFRKPKTANLKATMKTQKKKLMASITLAFSCAVTLSQAQIVANFTDGTGTSSVDQYNGIVGLGWATPWGTTDQLAPNLNPLVLNTAPINGGGNYLNVTTTTLNDNAVGRQFNGLTPSLTPVSFSFDLRIDSLVGWDNANDYLTVHANNSLSTYNVSAASSFIIRAFGASPAAGKNANEWLFYNGASNAGGYSAANFLNSGMTITAGTTYSFTIINDPATKKYNASIFDGVNTVSASDLGWRSSVASTALALNQRVGNSGDSLTYSLDNILIQEAPEPTSISLALLGGLSLIALRRRQSK
jgi:hypothetical protein